MSLREVAVNLIRQLDLELTGENLSKVQDTLVRIDDEADQAGHQSGLRAALEAGQEAEKLVLGVYEGVSMESMQAAGATALAWRRAIERLLEEAKGDDDDSV